MRQVRPVQIPCAHLPSQQSAGRRKGESIETLLQHDTEIREGEVVRVQGTLAVVK